MQKTGAMSWFETLSWKMPEGLTTKTRITAAGLCVKTWTLDLANTMQECHPSIAKFVDLRRRSNIQQLYNYVSLFDTYTLRRGSEKKAVNKTRNNEEETKRNTCTALVYAPVAPMYAYMLLVFGGGCARDSVPWVIDRTENDNWGKSDKHGNSH